ncbi:EF-P 5-aminopentanol modification-associated protein YfmH [Thermosediminibacter litoriperuensis]|uniref:Putative Zn-dependent peptidase n=1 Tax=Thermosediminibacter litoriperuensis TaxID=291989 RepID=A0A5S5ATE1_9FIRM|nr:pitrilysin family protein [Thermosediminibacter litoriperuensis]TYP54952.1 putative Zn-dependent peptidase [Thermosediminibacter litoriperuensis]
MDLIGENLFYRKFDNGLKAYVLPKKNYNKVYAVYSTRYGSIDSEFVVPGTGERLKVPEGIAHFLEHKMFEMSYGNVFDKFAELGTSSNAYTNYTNTTYLFSTTTAFEESMRLLLEFVETPYFTEESVEKEKGIITQELRMYEDDPEWQVLLNLLKALYHRHPVRDDIGGTVESIQKIDVDTLYKCYNTFYHPSNMVIFVAGAVEPEKVFDLIMEHEKNKDLAPQDEIMRIYPEEPDTICKPKIDVKLSVSQPIFLMGFKDADVGYDGVELLKKEITVSLLLEVIFGRSSVVYERLYEEGLIDDRFGFSYEGQKDYGFCTIGGETRDPVKLREELIKSISEVKEKGLSREDFERVKKKYLGDFIQGLNSLDFIANSFISYYHKNINIFDYPRFLKQITFEEVSRRLYDFFDFNRMASSTVYPKE